MIENRSSLYMFYWVEKQSSELIPLKERMSFFFANFTDIFAQRNAEIGDENKPIKNAFNLIKK